MGREEIRRLDLDGWESRFDFTYESCDPMLEWDCVKKIDKLLCEAEEILYGQDLIDMLGYTSQETKINELFENYWSYSNYVSQLPMEVIEVDHAFYADIKSNAVEDLSDIRQNKYKVTEGALAERDITLEDYVAGAVKTGWGGRKVELEELEEFSEMLKTRYWGMSLTSGIPMEEYVLQVFEMGEFDHEAYHPVRDFLSGLADTASVGIVPMLELLAGYDFITGEELTEGKVKEKGIEAAAGLVALALIPLTGGTSMGAKEAGKQILIESATGAVGYITYQTGESLDLSPEVTMLITLAGGVLTYKMLNGKFVSIDLADESVDVGVDAVEASVKSNADDVVGLLDDGIEGDSGQRYSVDSTMFPDDEVAGVLRNGEYIKNPTAHNINDYISEGSNYLGSKNMNGQYMYVVDMDGNIIIGTRGGQRMPHPTLVGGSNPQVQAAGMIEIRGGKIYSINNASGHFKPSIESLEVAEDVFSNLPQHIFSKDFQGYLPYGE